MMRDDDYYKREEYRRQERELESRQERQRDWDREDREREWRREQLEYEIERDKNYLELERVNRQIEALRQQQPSVPEPEPALVETDQPENHAPLADFSTKLEEFKEGMNRERSKLLGNIESSTLLPASVRDELYNRLAEINLASPDAGTKLKALAARVKHLRTSQHYLGLSELETGLVKLQRLVLLAMTGMVVFHELSRKRDETDG